MSPTSLDPAEYVDHLRARLRSTGTRQILGIAGEPGTGKSTFAGALADALGSEKCIVVPMDGFHLANVIIEGVDARDIDFVITEGNYLLSSEPPWDRIRSLVDEIWFVETPRALRVERLIERHIAFGMSRQAATAWATGPDEANARYIESTRHLADRQIAGG